MSKNTRWALAIVGVVILIVAAVVIGTGGDETTDAVDPGTTTEQPTQSTTTPTPATGQTGTEDNGARGGDEPGDDNGGDTGGAKPDDDSNSGSGGASPDGDDNSGTGGASTSGFSAAPLLVPGRTRTITVDKGDMVYLRAKSPESDELHIHGFDKTVELPAGKVVRYKFRANLDGVYEIELHHNGGQVATLKVNP